MLSNRKGHLLQNDSLAADLLGVPSQPPPSWPLTSNPQLTWAGLAHALGLGGSVWGDVQGRAQWGDRRQAGLGWVSARKVVRMD